MNRSCVAVVLKIPDNAAFTALVALRRLGLELERVERSDVWCFEDTDARPAIERVAADETAFNPNKHRLVAIVSCAPRPGEAWIERSDESGESPRHFVAWRLFGLDGSHVARETLAAGVDGLLCNPAIEKATY